jgi:ribosome biogenesis GTPase A
MNINWFPGHMAKAKREIKESLKLVDVVIELLDARIPLSSQNPDILELIGIKRRVVALNKFDLADDAKTGKWVQFFKKKGILAVPIDAISGKGIKELENVVRSIMRETLEQSAQKGRIGRSIRCAVLGIPNVGKSAFINKVAGRSAAIVADKPGVTRKNQWFKAGTGIELLDTPGVLWPKFEDPQVGLNLAFVGSIRSEIVDSIELAQKLAREMRNEYLDKLMQRYKITEDISGLEGYEILEKIGKKRGFIISGGEIDLERTAVMFLDEFRSGKLGKITLETPGVL